MFFLISGAQKKRKRKKYDPTYGMHYYNHPSLAQKTKLHLFKVPKNSANRNGIIKYCDKTKFYIDESIVCMCIGSVLCAKNRYVNNLVKAFKKFICFLIFYVTLHSETSIQSNQKSTLACFLFNQKFLPNSFKKVLRN